MGDPRPRASGRASRTASAGGDQQRGRAVGDLAGQRGGDHGRPGAAAAGRPSSRRGVAARALIRASGRRRGRSRPRSGPRRSRRRPGRGWRGRKSSISARVIPHLSAIMSAERNWEISCAPYRRCQPSEPLNGSPHGSPIAAAIGIMLMFCTPPATTRSAVPDSTAWAAKVTACWQEPHCRSTVTPGTCSGSPRRARRCGRCLPPAARRCPRSRRRRRPRRPGSLPARCEQGRDDVRAEIGRVRGGQAAAPAADGGAHRVDDVRP